MAKTGSRRRVSVAERVDRVRRISLTFGRIYIGIKTTQFVERQLGAPGMKRRWSSFNRDSAERIYELAVDLKGLILKGCQFLGSRADVLPPEYVEVLSRLQDRVPPHPFEVVAGILEEELGAPVEDLFEWISEQPIASASLAQVHEARLRTGERVAVKVQYPEVAALVQSDLGNLRALFRAVGVLERDYDLMPLVEELGEHVPTELDFVNEARNAEAIAKLLEERADVVIPRVFWEYTTRRVLVSEFVDGIKISDVAALRAANIDCVQVMQTLVEAYCVQILTHGFFHADPHPGNLLVLPPGRALADESAESARVVFLDFGLSKRLPPGFRQASVAFAAALLQGEPASMARALADLGFGTRDGSTEPLELISGVILEAARQMRHQSYMDRKVTQKAGREIPRIVRENPIVRIPTHVVLLGRVIALLSGLGHTLDARIDMLRTILPYAVPTPLSESSSGRSRSRSPR
jgi:predicted unusual protein kinase regulating ubiquinone biosynthesis (AarF/ABC1/UbiB family)